MWLTPVRALVMFSLINMLTYLDRGAFAACLDTIEKDLALSNVDGGFIGSCVRISVFHQCFGSGQSGQAFKCARFNAFVVLYSSALFKSALFAPTFTHGGPWHFFLVDRLTHNPQAPTWSALSAPR
jgi:hypothetical protein